MKNLFASVLMSARAPLGALGSAVPGHRRVFGPVFGFAAILLLAGVVSAQEPLVTIAVTPKPDLSENAVWNKPLVITSGEQAAEHFDQDALKTLKSAVDWEKQFVLVFVWRGSGQDKLEYNILESYPEQIPFSLKPGMTRDLRLHSRVFALRANVKWSVK